MYSITDLHRLTLKKFLYMNLLCDVVGTGFTEAMIKPEEQLVYYSQKFIKNLNFSKISHPKYVVLQLKNLVSESRERAVTVLNNLCSGLSHEANLGGNFTVDPRWQKDYELLVIDQETKQFSSFQADYEGAQKYCTQHLGNGGFYSLDTYRNILQIPVSPEKDFNHALMKHCFLPWRVLPIVKSIMHAQRGDIPSADFLSLLEVNKDYTEVRETIRKTQNCGHSVRVIDLPREALKVQFLRKLSLNLNENDHEQCYYFAALVMMNWFANITSASGTICKHKPKSEGSDPELILSVNFYTQECICVIDVIGGIPCRLFFAIHWGKLFATFYAISRCYQNNEVDKKISWSILTCGNPKQYVTFSHISAEQKLQEVAMSSNDDTSSPGQLIAPELTITSDMEIPKPSEICLPRDFEARGQNHERTSEQNRGGHGPRGGRGNRRGRGRQQQHNERNDFSHFNCNVPPESSPIDAPKIESGKDAEALPRTADTKAPVSTSNNAKASPKKTKKQLDEEARLAKLKELAERKKADDAAKALKKEQQRQKELDRRAKRQEEEKRKAEALQRAMEQEEKKREENKRKMEEFAKKQAAREQEQRETSKADQQPSGVSQPGNMQSPQQIAQNTEQKQGNNAKSTTQDSTPAKNEEIPNNAPAQDVASNNEQMNSTGNNAQNHQDRNSTQTPMTHYEICLKVADNLESIMNYMTLDQAQFEEVIEARCAGVNGADENLAKNIAIYLSKLSGLAETFKRQTKQKKQNAQINITKLLTQPNDELRKKLTAATLDDFETKPGLFSTLSVLLLSQKLTLDEFRSCVQCIYEPFHEYFLLSDFRGSLECIDNFNTTYGGSLEQIIKNAEIAAGYDVTKGSVAAFVSDFWKDFKKLSKDVDDMQTLKSLFEAVQQANRLNGSLLDNVENYNCQFTYEYLTLLKAILASKNVDNFVANLRNITSILLGRSIIMRMIPQADEAKNIDNTTSILSNPESTLQKWYPSVPKKFLDPWIRTLESLPQTNGSIQDLTSYVIIIGSLTFKPKNLFNLFKTLNSKNLINRKIMADPNMLKNAAIILNKCADAGISLRNLRGEPCVVGLSNLVEKLKGRYIHALEYFIFYDMHRMMERMLKLGANPNIIIDDYPYSTYFSEILTHKLLVLRQEQTAKNGQIDLVEKKRLGRNPQHLDKLIKLCVEHGVHLNNPIDPGTNQPFYPDLGGIPLVFAINTDQPEILKLLLDSYSEDSRKISELLLSLPAEDVPVLVNLKVNEKSRKLESDDYTPRWRDFLHSSIENFGENRRHVSLATYSLWRSIMGFGDFMRQWSIFKIMEPFVNATSLLMGGFIDYYVGSELITNAACILFRKIIRADTAIVNIDTSNDFQIVKQVVAYALKIMDLYLSNAVNKKAFLHDTVMSMKNSGDYIMSQRVLGGDISGMVDALVIKVAGLMGLSEEGCRQILENNDKEEEQAINREENFQLPWEVWIEDDNVRTGCVEKELNEANELEQQNFGSIVPQDDTKRAELEQGNSGGIAPWDNLAIKEMANPLSDFSFLRKSSNSTDTLNTDEQQFQRNLDRAIMDSIADEWSRRELAAQNEIESSHEQENDVIQENEDELPPVIEPEPSNDNSVSADNKDLEKFDDID